MDSQFDGHDIYLDDPETEYYCAPLETNKSTGFTLLQKLILTNDKVDRYDEIKELIDRQPEVINQPNTSGWTALMIACTNSRKYKLLNIIKLLLDCPGIDVNMQLHTVCGQLGPANWSSLMLAARNSGVYSNIETVKLLLKHPNINANLQNNEGHTALTLAVRDLNKHSNVDTVELLLNHPGIDAQAQTYDGRTAMSINFLRHEKMYSDTLVAKLLLNHLAQCGSIASCTNYVYASGCRINILIHMAASGDTVNNIKMIELLLNYSGASIDINERGSDGDTALDRAIDIGSLHTIALLCAHGASLANSRHTIETLESDGLYDIVRIIQSYDIPTKGVVIDG